MEISEQTILKLVESQGALTQAVTDVKDRFDKAIPYLVSKDEENAKDIKAVEKKIWYFGGAGTTLGFIASHFGAKYFGGK